MNRRLNPLYCKEADTGDDTLLEQFHHVPERIIQAISTTDIVTTQDFIFIDCVDFYVRAIRSGMLPQPLDGLRMEDNKVFLIEGNHRLHAWIKCGFRDVPMRVQAKPFNNDVQDINLLDS